MVAHAVKPSSWETESGRSCEFKASLILHSEFQDIQSHIVKPCVIKPKTKIKKNKKNKGNKNPTQAKQNKIKPPNLITQFMLWWYYLSIFSPYIFIFLSTPAKMKKEERVRENC